MRENIIIKRGDDNLKNIVIDYEWKQVSVADLLDEYEKLCNAIFCIKTIETFSSRLVEFNDLLKKIRSEYENSQNA